ncbi:unnamed protein product [Fusarium graminearum]|nr:unnamed protein product [Fusarium graminearum]
MANRAVMGDPVSFNMDGGKYNHIALNDESDAETLDDMSLYYNKSVPIYILDPNEEADDIGTGILKFLDIWLYRQWFKPYESDINFGRYIARTTLLRWEKTSQKPSLDDINHFHEGLCYDLTGGMFNGFPSELLDHLKTNYLDTQKGTFETKEDILAAFNKTFVVQPTFWSFFIVMEQTHGLTEGPFRADDIGNIAVSLVCTNCCNPSHSRESPSYATGPCCSTRTTLKAAIRFIMDLDEKLPTVRKTRQSAMKDLDGFIDIEKEAGKMGWDTDKHGNFPLDQPCSTWVDRAKYKELTGAGAIKHAESVVHGLKYLNTTVREVPLEDHWWWYDSVELSPRVMVNRPTICVALLFWAIGCVVRLLSFILSIVCCFALLYHFTSNLVC